jgi:glutamate racemase
MSKTANRNPIGVFDSGIGGLTVLKELLSRLPDESFVYFGDTARVPYGTKSAETVRRFSRENIRLLLDRGVKMVVIACNTASSEALPALAALIGRAKQPRQLIKAPLRTLTPRSGGHLSAIRQDLDQGRSDRRTRGTKLNVAKPAVGRVPRAAAQLSEDRAHQGWLLEPDVAGQAVH